MSSGAFKALARDLAAPADAALLDLCVLDPALAGDRTVPSAFIQGWLQWERALRLNLARQRAQKLKREFPLEPPDDPVGAVAAAKAAIALESPLEAELYLDRARWDAVTALEGFEYFSRDRLYAYLLKLLLLERHDFFKAEEGYAEYNTIYASIMNAASLGEAAYSGAISTESGETT
jgi:hypothetical protein